MPAEPADSFRPVFVLGTGRCGSTLLHEILARHRGVAFISNLEDRLALPPAAGLLNGHVHRALPPRAARKGGVRFAPSEGYNALAREVSPLLVDPERDLLAADASPWLASRMQTFFRRRAEMQRSPVVLHKFTGWPRTGFLRAVFPDARFVHVVRDGRGVAASWLRMPWWHGHRGPDRWGFGPLPEKYAREWYGASRSFVVLAGIAWKLLLDAYDDARRCVPAGAWLDVHYEDLVAEPEKTTRFVTEFAGFAPDGRFSAQVRRYRLEAPEDPRVTLGEPAVAELEASLAAHLERWGYRSLGYG